jgi:hypothetical protein
VEETLQLEIGSGGGFPAVARWFDCESLFGAGAELLNAPGEIGGADVLGDAFGESLG